MKKILLLCVGTAFFTFMVHPAVSQDVYIFPNKDQSAETLEKDKYQCYQWAKQQTNFDPSQPATVSSSSGSNQRQGEVLKGAARGALVGAVIGEIADDDAGKGAAIGAAGGGLFGGMKRRNRVASEQAQQQQQQQAYANLRSNYNRAYAACLEAKDYTVK